MQNTSYNNIDKSVKTKCSENIIKVKMSFHIFNNNDKKIIVFPYFFLNSK